MGKGEFPGELHELMENVITLKFGELKPSILKMQEMEGEAAAKALYFVYESMGEDNIAEKNVKAMVLRALLKRRDVVYFWVLSKKENALGGRLADLLERLPKPDENEWARILWMAMEKYNESTDSAEGEAPEEVRRKVELGMLAERMAKEAVSEMADDGRPGVAAVLRKAAKGDWEMLSLRALRALAQKNDMLIFDDVKALMGDPGEKRAEIGIYLMGEMAGRCNSHAIRELKGVLIDGGGNYRNDSDPRRRAAVVEVVEQLVGRSILKKELFAILQKVAMEESQPLIRVNALRVFGNHGTTHVNFLENFCRRDTDNPVMIRNALDQLHRIGTEKARDAMERLFQSSGLSSENRRYAQKLLKEKWVPKQEFGLPRQGPMKPGTLMKQMAAQAKQERARHGRDLRVTTLSGMPSPVRDGSKR